MNREHDAVTIFVKEHFRDPFAKSGINFMIRQLLFARIFNQPETLKLACPLEDFDAALKALKARRAAGRKLFRGVYIMPTHGAGAGGCATEYWMGVIAFSETLNYSGFKTLEDVAELMVNEVGGVGPFLANQICADLRYVPGWGADYEDWSHFLMTGPGTRRGVNRYFDRDPKAGGKDEKFADGVRAIRDELNGEIPDEIHAHFRDVNNLSNSFCEFDKYERARMQSEAGERITLKPYRKNIE